MDVCKGKSVLGMRGRRRGLVVAGGWGEGRDEHGRMDKDRGWYVTLRDLEKT